MLMTGRVCTRSSAAFLFLLRRGGSHVVVVRMNGFAEWKRELTVEPGSELTINAVLQKGQ